MGTSKGDHVSARRGGDAAGDSSGVERRRRSRRLMPRRQGRWRTRRLVAWDAGVAPVVGNVRVPRRRLGASLLTQRSAVLPRTAVVCTLSKGGDIAACPCETGPPRAPTCRRRGAVPAICAPVADSAVTKQREVGRIERAVAAHGVHGVRVRKNVSNQTAGVEPVIRIGRRAVLSTSRAAPMSRHSITDSPTRRTCTPGVCRSRFLPTPRASSTAWLIVSMATNSCTRFPSGRTSKAASNCP